MIEAYPLCWPPDYPRSVSRRDSKFKTTTAVARDYVKDEIRRIGGSSPIISTNLPLKANGDLYADAGSRISDPGVAVYFTRKKQQVCLCCDSYTRVWENLHAVGRTIAALRQIDRDGVSDFLNRTFTGFGQLPPAAVINQKSIWEILGLVNMPGDVDAVHRHYKMRAKECHPDQPTGSVKAFQELNEAYQQALKSFN